MKTLRQRFEAKYQPSPDGCWLWIGAGDRYGQLADEDGHTVRPAHRIAWKLFRGEIPDGMNVLHHCDTPRCVNPDHLFLGTQSDNVRDMANKRRHHAQQPDYRAPWAKLSVANVATIIGSAGDRAEAVAGRFGVSPRRVYQIWRERAVARSRAPRKDRGVR